MLMYFFLILICLIFPEISVHSANESVYLWFTSVLPVLFPFFILTKALLYSGGDAFFKKLLSPLMRILLLPTELAYPLFISILCGYPNGSRLLGQTNLRDNTYCASVCFSSGPLFIIGTVGTVMLKNKSAGVALYIIHICTLLVLTVLLRPKHVPRPKETNAPKGSFSSAVGESVIAILNICGFMVFFGIISKLISLADFLPYSAASFLSGLCEFTGGIKALSKIDALPAISFLLSFGGACVIAQCFSFLSVKKIKFIVCRIIAGTIAFAFCVIYEKTAIYVPIIITVAVIILNYILRRNRIIS